MAAKIYLAENWWFFLFHSSFNISPGYFLNAYNRLQGIWQLSSYTFLCLTNVKQGNLYLLQFKNKVCREPRVAHLNASRVKGLFYWVKQLSNGIWDIAKMMKRQQQRQHQTQLSAFIAHYNVRIHLEWAHSSVLEEVLGESLRSCLLHSVSWTVRDECLCGSNTRLL